jgi:hypothetical protein
MKLRIAAAAATGVILIGILARPLAAPTEPSAALSLHTGTLSLGSAIVLAVLAVLAGLIAYFFTWPHGREIGILAVPSGLAFWAVRSGTMASLMQHTAAAQRQELFATLKWEPVFWLAIVAAGFAGVMLAQKISGRKVNPAGSERKSNSKLNMYLNAAVALVGSVLIAQFCITIFARDIRIFDDRLGSIVVQPAVSQVVFAVLVSFGLAAFIVKAFLNVSYIWPIIASALVIPFAITIYVKQNVLQHLVEHHPAAFFSNAVISILPLQMVAFGTLGSIAGYWMAVRYHYWRKHG